MVSIDPGNIKLQDAIDATAAMSLRELPDHVCVGPMPPGAITPLELPLRDLDSNSTGLRHFVDKVLDIDPSQVEWQHLKAIVRDQAWRELPTVMQFKIRPAFETVIQYFLLPQTDEKICLLKHVHITSDKIKVKGAYIKTLLQGQGYELQWHGANKKLARKGFQWLLEQLGGSQIRCYSLSPEIRAVKPKAPEPDEAAWNFLLEHGEMDKSGLKQLRWIHAQIHDPQSPIHGWSDKLVQRALDSLANDSCVAKLSTRYDLTMHDVEPEVRDIMEIIVPQLRTHSLWLLGEPGKGKTPLGRIVAMMFSRFHGEDGAFRSTCDLDFFRGIHFNPAIPALYDDGDIGAEAVKKKKAFADVADEQTMTRERWTNAKFVRHQLRIVLDNAYNPDAEPADGLMETALTVQHDDFFHMMRPALGNISVTDAMAILKRSAVVIFSKKFIYYRMPSQEIVPVQRIRWSKLDILKDSCKPVLKNFLDGGSPPSSFQENALWEQATRLHSYSLVFDYVILILFNYKPMAHLSHVCM